MTKGRVFQFDVDLKNKGAIREYAHKRISEGKTTLRLLFGLDSELNLVEPHILNNDVLVGAKDLMGNYRPDLRNFYSSCKQEGKSVYYPLNSLTYVCILTVVEEGDKRKSTVRLYLPSGVEKNGIFCRDVTVVFPLQSRNALAEVLSEYVTIRL